MIFSNRNLMFSVETNQVWESQRFIRFFVSFRNMLTFIISMLHMVRSSVTSFKNAADIDDVDLYLFFFETF